MTKKGDRRTIAEQSSMSFDDELVDWLTRAGLVVPAALLRSAKTKKPARSTEPRRVTLREKRNG